MNELHTYKFEVEIKTFEPLTNSTKQKLRAKLKEAVLDISYREQPIRFYDIDFTSYRFQKGIKL